MPHSQPQATGSREPRKWRVVAKRVALVLAAAFLIAATVAGFVVKDYVRSLWSLRRVPDTNMYVMDYYGTYNLAEVYDHGVDITDLEGSLIRVFLPRLFAPVGDWINRRGKSAAAPPRHPAPPFACATVAVRAPNGRVYFGRNFDWTHDPCLIVRIHGGERTGSVAVLDPHSLGLDKGKTSVYDLSTGEYRITYRRRYDGTYQDRLPMR
jgi:hypothetical protein